MQYIVCAPSYDENNGGAIFLHQLVHVLNALGEQASVWSMPEIYPVSKRQRLRRIFQPLRFETSAELNTPVYSQDTAPDDAIVVYPELLRGNPLKAKNIVRWLLYKPGVLHPYEFTEGEMFFHCGEMFDMPELTGGAPELVMWRRNRTYRNENRADRKGTCYIVRKGFEKPRLPETEAPGAIQIDDMSHAEINEVFNSCETFISYDEATMYSQFAAICGCDSIIVPGIFASHEDWLASHPLAPYGVAYGFEALPHARATRDKVRDFLDQQENDSKDSVRNFIKLTKERFGAKTKLET